jgi:hypothetical protein
MTHNEFTYWLKGFIAGKTDLDEAQLITLKDMINQIEEKPTVQRVTEYPPQRYNPNVIPNPMNPTCETGRQLLRDDKRRNRPI